MENEKSYTSGYWVISHCIFYAKEYFRYTSHLVNLIYKAFLKAVEFYSSKIINAN